MHDYCTCMNLYTTLYSCSAQSSKVFTASLSAVTCSEMMFIRNAGTCNSLVAFAYTDESIYPAVLMTARPSLPPIRFAKKAVSRFIFAIVSQFIFAINICDRVCIESLLLCSLNWPVGAFAIYILLWYSLFGDSWLPLATLCTKLG